MLAACNSSNGNKGYQNEISMYVGHSFSNYWAPYPTMKWVAKRIVCRLIWGRHKVRTFSSEQLANLLLLFLGRISLWYRDKMATVLSEAVSEKSSYVLKLWIGKPNWILNVALLLRDHKKDCWGLFENVIKTIFWHFIHVIQISIWKINFVEYYNRLWTYY